MIERFYKQFVEPFPSWLWEQATHNRLSRNAGYIDEFARSQTKSYMESPWSQSKYEQYLQMKQNPITGYYIGLYESGKDAADYLNNHNIDWSGVNRPWKLPNSSVGSVGHVINYLSKNVEELYG